MHLVCHRQASGGNPERASSSSAGLKEAKGGGGCLSGVLLVAALTMAGSWRAEAQTHRHLSVVQPGGYPGIPVLTGITKVTTNVMEVTWDSPAGYCQLYQKRNLTDPTWQLTGSPYNLNGAATVTDQFGQAFFRVSSAPPRYAGARSCLECHSGVLNALLKTPHARTNFFTSPLWLAQGGGTNASCLSCHTVGHNLPSGFTSPSATPQLAGVQCENCHGPAGNHQANPGIASAKPRVDIAGTVCGGCHNAAYVPSSAAATHLPYYEEWSASGHGEVLDELKEDFATASFIQNCGACHSGTIRTAYLNQEALPGAEEAGAVGISCVICHDAHQLHTYTNVVVGATNPVTGQVVIPATTTAVYTNQLLYPLTSLQDYHTTTNFTASYNPQISVCGQCHNDRNATYTTSSGPPHHSPQYNMLLGTVGVVDPLAPTNAHFLPATHAYAAKQCVTCHMQDTPGHGPSQPGNAGHRFGAITNSAGCSGSACHGAGDVANLLVPVVAGIIQTNTVGYPVHPISEVHSKLVEWAITKAPAILGTTAYGTNAWGYTRYSAGDPFVGGPGPTAGLQALIPTNIKIARFNLYIVQNDGSFGTHNFEHTVDLLNIAYDLVAAELAK